MEGKIGNFHCPPFPKTPFLQVLVILYSGHSFMSHVEFIHDSKAIGNTNKNLPFEPKPLSTSQETSFPWGAFLENNTLL